MAGSKKEELRRREQSSMVAKKSFILAWPYVEESVRMI
jgi:hypothetical protein